MSKRIQITREDLVAQFIEVKQTPLELTDKFQKAPFCHLLSSYVIRPVACDQLPFFIHHKNKQPITTSHIKKPRNNKKTGLQVENFDDPDPIARDTKKIETESDDEFETVQADKKRAKKPAFIPVQEFNPQFPASDPTKVKVIERSTKPAAKKKVDAEVPKLETAKVVPETK